MRPNFVKSLNCSYIILDGISGSNDNKCIACQVLSSHQFSLAAACKQNEQCCHWQCCDSASSSKLCRASCTESSSEQHLSDHLSDHRSDHRSDKFDRWLEGWQSRASRCACEAVSSSAAHFVFNIPVRQKKSIGSIACFTKLQQGFN